MKNIIHFILRYKVTILLFIFFIGLNLKIHAKYPWEGNSFLFFLTYSVANSIFVLLIFNIIAKLWLRKNLILKVLSYIIYISTSLLLILDLFLIFSYNNQVNIGIFASICETNIVEAKSMIKEYWSTMLIVVIGVFLLNRIAIKELAKTKIKIKISLLLMVFITFFSPILYMYRNTERFDKKNLYYKMLESTWDKQPLLTYNFLLHYSSPLVLNDIFIFISYINERNRINNFKNIQRILPDGITPSTSKKMNIPNKIYIIIGESSYRKHLSLYGYSYKTTPFLDSLSQESNSQLSFFNAISPASITRESLKLTLTFATPNDNTPFYENKSIIGMAKDQKYQTIWLSNQPKFGIYENYVTLLGSSNDTIKYISHEMNEDDLSLIKELPNFYKKNEKQFIFLHIRGSHKVYDEGYDKQDILNIENQESKSYDRTIHHTDRFLRQLHDFIKSKDESAILFYFSDHGEMINYGHGFDNGIQQFEIPLLSIKYNTEINTDSIIKTYINKETNLINSLSTSYILSEFIGYNITSDLKKEVIEEGNYVFNCNSKVLLFKDVQPLEGSIK